MSFPCRGSLSSQTFAGVRDTLSPQGFGDLPKPCGNIHRSLGIFGDELYNIPCRPQRVGKGIPEPWDGLGGKGPSSSSMGTSHYPKLLQVSRLGVGNSKDIPMHFPRENPFPKALM